MNCTINNAFLKYFTYFINNNKEFTDQIDITQSESTKFLLYKKFFSKRSSNGGRNEALDTLYSQHYNSKISADNQNIVEIMIFKITKDLCITDDISRLHHSSNFLLN